VQGDGEVSQQRIVGALQSHCGQTHLLGTSSCGRHRCPGGEVLLNKSSLRIKHLTTSLPLCSRSDIDRAFSDAARGERWFGC
jgi:hypothetical protein